VQNQREDYKQMLDMIKVEYIKDKHFLFCKST
jgi:hypothetical protein